MKITENLVPVTHLVSQKVVKYKPKDIEELIIQDLQNKGFVGTAVKFNSNYAYETDTWGMNSHIVVSFDGATIEVK